MTDQTVIPPDLSEPVSDEQLRHDIIEEWQFMILEKVVRYFVIGSVLILIMSLLTRIFPAFLCGL